MGIFNNNRAVTIAIDTILIFGILTTFLTITYLSMGALNQASERAVMREEFSTIGHDIGRKFVNLNSEVSASFAYSSDIDFEYKVDIPPLIAGNPYEVTIKNDGQIVVKSRGGQDITVIVPLRDQIPVYESTISSTDINHVIAYDKGSGLVWFKSDGITPPPDLEKPTISIVSPPASDYSNPSTHINNDTQISINISDDVAIARVEYYTTYIDVPPGENMRTILRDSVATYRDSIWTWKTMQPCTTIQTYLNGNYTLKIIVYDRVGNRAEVERNYTINNTNNKGPEIKYLQPTNSSTWCESSDVIIELDYCDRYPGVNISTGRLWLRAWNESTFEKFDEEIDLGSLISETNVTEVNLTASASFTQTHLTYRIPYDSPILAHAKDEDAVNPRILFKVTVSLNDTDRSNTTHYPDGKWLENDTGATNIPIWRDESNLSWKFVYSVIPDNDTPYTNISIPQDEAIVNVGDRISFTYIAEDETCGLRSILLEARDTPGNNLLTSHTFNYSGEKSTDLKTYSLDAYYQAGIAYNLSITAWDWGNNTNTTSNTIYTTCRYPGLITLISTPAEGIWSAGYSSYEIPIYARVNDDCEPATGAIVNVSIDGAYTTNLTYNTDSRAFIGTWNISGVNLSKTYLMNVSAVNDVDTAYDLVNGTIEIGWTGVSPLVGYGEQYDGTSTNSDSWVTNGTGDGENLAELKNFFVTNNETHIFFRVDLAGNYSIYNDTNTLTDIAIFIDTDQNYSTGFNNTNTNTTNDYFPIGMGADFAIFDANGTAQPPLYTWSSFGIYNYTNPWFGFSTFPTPAQNRTVDSSPDWVEMWFPLAALNVSAGDTITLIAEGRDNFTIDQIPNPVPNNVTGINYGANYTIT